VYFRDLRNGTIITEGEVCHSKGSKIAKILWIWVITNLDYGCLAQVTVNNGGFLIKLVYNNSLVGFLDEYNHLYYPAMLC